MPDLHKKYDPIVRIAPDQVIVCSEDAIESAYSAGTTFTKGEWYQGSAAPDKKRNGDNHFDLYTELDLDKYKKQRRKIGPAYSIAGMVKHEVLLNAYINTSVARLRSLGGKLVDSNYTELVTKVLSSLPS